MNIIKQESVLSKCIFASLLVSDSLDASYNLFAPWQNRNRFQRESEDGEALGESSIFMAASESHMEDILLRACNLSSILEVHSYRRLQSDEYEWSHFIYPFSETCLFFNIDCAPLRLKACILECLHRNMFLSRKKDVMGNTFLSTNFSKDEEVTDLFESTKIVMLLALKVLLVAASFSEDPCIQRAKIYKAFDNTLKKKKIVGKIFDDLKGLIDNKCDSMVDAELSFDYVKLNDLFQSYCNKYILSD